MKYKKNLCGSTLEIIIFDDGNFENLVEKTYNIVYDFEQKYSRFISGNLLDNLNIQKQGEMDEEFISLVQLCIKVSEITHGNFDISIGPVLEKLGYGKNNNIQYNTVGYQNIIIENNTVFLKNNISIELGSIGKGYLIDKIYNFLDTKIQSFSINFGGDIRVKGSHTIKLEGYAHDFIGEICLENSSFAASSSNKRRFHGSHHLINGKTKHPQNDKLIVYLTHRLGMMSDVFSTALFVTPLEKSIEILSSIQGLEGMIIDQKGNIHKSKGFQINFYS